MLRRGAIHLGVVGALVVPSAAWAQESARPDPNSPAGVEYQLPLDQARRQSDGDRERNRRDSAGPGKRTDGGGSASGGGSTGGSEDDSPLFGEGISPGGGGGSEAGNAQGGDGRSGDAGTSGKGDRISGPGSSAAGDARADAGERPGNLSQTAARDNGSNSTLLTGAILLAVLLIGALTALVVRKGSRGFGS